MRECEYKYVSDYLFFYDFIGELMMRLRTLKEGKEMELVENRERGYWKSDLRGRRERNIKQETMNTRVWRRRGKEERKMIFFEFLSTYDINFP